MAQNVRGSGLQLRRCRLHLTLLAFTPLFFVLTFFRIQFCAIYSIHNRPQVISRSPGRLPSLESHLRPSLHQDYQLEVNLVFFFSVSIDGRCQRTLNWTDVSLRSRTSSSRLLL